MPANSLARAGVFDPIQFKKYTDRIPVMIEQYSGRILFRGAPHETFEGPNRFDRFVLIEFDTVANARRCFELPESVETAEHRRHGAGENEFTIVDGGENTQASSHRLERRSVPRFVTGLAGTPLRAASRRTGECVRPDNMDKFR